MSVERLLGSCVSVTAMRFDSGSSCMSYMRVDRPAEPDEAKRAGGCSQQHFLERLTACRQCSNCRPELGLIHKQTFRKPASPARRRVTLKLGLLVPLSCEPWMEEDDTNYEAIVSFTG